MRGAVFLSICEGAQKCRLNAQDIKQQDGVDGRHMAFSDEQG
ncbi:hypothetical protein AA3266_2653 [Gluconobacter kondonii NBRC 3266]|nr:hypothetical protein AA3266_2653 [Gluconobacter kondonii NBRC 3266]